MRQNLGLLTLVAMLSIPTVVNAAEIDWKKVDAALGKTAAVSGEVHRYGLPRSDLQVALDGVAIKPALALGGWVSFAPVHGEAMVMGDLVLLETEITPVMTKLLDGGLDITAIHNHILRASPATFYMHVAGHHRRPGARCRSRHREARPNHGRQRHGQRRRLSIRRAAPRSQHGKRNAGEHSARRRQRHQLSADRQRQSRDHG